MWLRAIEGERSEVGEARGTVEMPFLMWNNQSLSGVSREEGDGGGKHPAWPCCNNSSSWILGLEMENSLLLLLRHWRSHHSRCPDCSFRSQ
jgi:hypothetical protein